MYSYLISKLYFHFIEYEVLNKQKQKQNWYPTAKQKENKSGANNQHVSMENALRQLTGTLYHVY